MNRGSGRREPDMENTNCVKENRLEAIRVGIGGKKDRLGPCLGQTFMSESRALTFQNTRQSTAKLNG